MPLGDVFRVADEQLMQGQLVVNTHHYILAAGTDDEAALTLAVTFKNIIVPLMRAIQTDAVLHVKVVAQKIFPAPALAIQESTVGQAGIVDQVAMPITVAMVFRRRGPLANRKNMGRIFVSGIATSNYDATSGRFIVAQSDPAFVAMTNALDTQLAEGIPGGSVFEPVLYNRTTGATTLIEKASRDNVPRNQRRRQLGVGV